MKFTYAIHPDHRVIFQRYEGRFTTSDLIAATRQMWADPAYCRDYNGIADASAASFGVDLHDFSTFISFLANREEMSVGRWAVVATSPLATACGFIYKKAVSSQHKFEVFSSWDAACDFVNLPQTLENFSQPASLTAPDQPKKSTDLAAK